MKRRALLVVVLYVLILLILTGPVLYLRFIDTARLSETREALG